MNKQTRKYILYISILLIFSGIAMYFVLKDDALEIWKTITSSDYRFILIGCGLFLVSLILNGLFLVSLTRFYNRNFKLRQGIANHMIGQFFSGITPSSSGGQFVQAYTFTKQGVGVSQAASILFMAFIIRQTVAVLFSAITFPLRFAQMMGITQTINILGIDFNLIMLSALGFVINVFILLGLFFLAFFKPLHHFVVHNVIGFLKKIHVYSEEKAQRKIQEIDTKVATFRIELKRLLSNWKILLLSILIAFLDVIVYNSYPYVMGMAVHAEVTGSYLDALCMSNFLSLITMMIPIPGAAGGAELVFQFMFSNFMGGSPQYVNSINLLWRFFTFYLGVFLGALVFIFYRGSPKKEAMAIDRKAFLDVEVLSLTQELHFEMNQSDLIEKEVPQDNKTKGKRSRKKYRPSVMDDEESVEEHFAHLKQELQPQFDSNEEILLKEDEIKEENLENNEDKKES